MSRSPGLQKLHLSHHPSSHGHPQTGRQPQQSPRYAHIPLPSNTISCLVTKFIRVQYQKGFWNESYSRFSDNWWSLMDCEVFTRLVEMYKSIVVFLLTGGRRSWYLCFRRATPVPPCDCWRSYTRYSEKPQNSLISNDELSNKLFDWIFPSIRAELLFFFCFYRQACVI